MFLIERIESTVIAGGTKEKGLTALKNKMNINQEIKESFNQGIARAIALYNADKKMYLDEGYKLEESQSGKGNFAARLVNGYGIVEVRYSSKKYEENENSIIAKTIRYEMHEIVEGRKDTYISML